MAKNIVYIGEIRMELIKQVQRGDKEAFEALFYQYKDTVYNTAYLIMGNSEDAEDIVQEVFVKVYSKASTFQAGRGSIDAWLHRITVNQCIDERRKKRPVSSHNEIELRGTDSDILLKSIIEEERREVWEALKSLDKKHRLVLVLRYYEELPYEEIAERLSIPLGTVKSRINKALGTLRKKLKRKGG